jgi:CRISPR type III-A-associated protein Csm2
MKGKIKNINSEKKFGFIISEEGKELYFNDKGLAKGFTFSALVPNLEVEFEVDEQGDGSAKGATRQTAKNVRPKDIEEISFFKEHVLDLSEKKEYYDTFCDYAEKYAERLKSGKVTTSMIRKIYARILNARTVTDVKLLRPHFAYTSGRNEKNRILREFMDLLDYLAKKIDSDNEQHLNNFKQFMETIVAYRKYVGEDK